MDKKRLLWVVAGLVAIVAFGVWGWDSRKSSLPTGYGLEGMDSMDIRAYMDSLTADFVPDSLPADDYVSENYKLVDESVVPYMVPELCGYNPRNLRMGVITVRRDMDPEVYARAFPRLSGRKGQVDTIPDVFLYIKPMSMFPEGEYGKVAYVLANDSVIQIQFVRGGVEEMVQSVSTRLDAVSGQLQDLADRLQHEEKD